MKERLLTILMAIGFSCIVVWAFCSCNVAHAQERIELNYSQAYSTAAEPTGWDNNPNNPHYPGPTQAPLDNGVIFLLAAVVVYGLLKARKKGKQSYEWIN